MDRGAVQQTGQCFGATDFKQFRSMSLVRVPFVFIASNRAEGRVQSAL